jgi:hypothetical protein
MVFGTISRLFGMAASPFGVLACLLGFVTFFLIPLLGAVSRFEWPSNFMFWLAARPLSRAAIVISESNDAVFKRMQFSEPGVERIEIGDEEKSFEDPDGALHWWRGLRFALANEPDGTLFDPRHAAIGMQKRLFDQREETSYWATDQEAHAWGIMKWMPAVFELPSRHQILDLSHVRELVDGGERAEYPQRVEMFYRHSQDPFKDGPNIMKFLYPVISFCIPFFGMWILASQIGTGGGRSTSVSFGTLAILLLIAGRGPPVRKILAHIKNLIQLFVLVLFVIGVPAGVFTLLWVYAGPVAAVALTLSYLAGFFALPLVSFLFGFSTGLSVALARLYMKLGFLAYRKPVFEWTPWAYRLREYSDLEAPDEIAWYGLFGNQVGFTYTPDPEIWDEGERYPPSDVRELGTTAVADGGDRESNLPPKYRPAPSIKRDSYGGFVPARVDDDAHYLNSAVALNRFSGSANGKMSMERLLLAKEKWGGNTDAIRDQTVLYLSAAMGLLGVILGVVFFIL